MPARQLHSHRLQTETRRGMKKSQRPPRIVAELGRPETPEETAERKARDSRLYRQRKTLNNLVLSLLVTLGMVVVIVLAVPRGNYVRDTSVDVVTLAESAQGATSFALTVPNLPDSWSATQAELRSSSQEGIEFWYVGYLTPDEQFAAFKQTPDANPTWLADQLENKSATGVESRDGVEWTVYDHTDNSGETTNVRYALTTELDGTTFIVYGTSAPDNIWQLAGAVVASFAAQQPSPSASAEIS